MKEGAQLVPCSSLCVWYILIGHVTTQFAFVVFLNKLHGRFNSSLYKYVWVEMWEWVENCCVDDQSTLYNFPCSNKYLTLIACHVLYLSLTNYNIIYMGWWGIVWVTLIHICHVVYTWLYPCWIRIWKVHSKLCDIMFVTATMHVILWNNTKSTVQQWR